MSIRTRYLVAGAIALLAAIGVSTGTSPGAAASPAASSASSCLDAPATPETSRPVVAVLAGITTHDVSRQIDAQRSAAMTKIVSAGFAMQARLLVDVVGGGVGDADLAVNTQLQASGPNQLFRESSMDCKTVGIALAFSRLLRHTSVQPIDVVSAIRVLQGQLTGLTKGPIDVVFLSSMLNGTAPIDLANPVTLAQDTATAVAKLSQTGLMPDCSGWNVYMVGAGRTAHGGIGDTADVELDAFWTAFFKACGGRVVVNDNELTQFPVKPERGRSTSARSGVAGLSVSRQVSDTGQTQLSVTLAGSVLFASASASLAPQATRALDSLLTDLAIGHPSGAVEVTGYTDSVPSDIPGGNEALSLQRARAVADWLVAHGIAPSRLQVVGGGSSDPVGDNSTTAGRAENRRVVVTVTLPKGSS